jgi:hypothetical protein
MTVDRRPETEDRLDQRGIALVMTLLVMVLLSALGLSLTLVTSTEERVASSYRDGTETFYAADAMFERVVEELALVADWNRVLDGSVTSSFVDSGVAARGWPGEPARSPVEATALVRCGQMACSAADIDRPTTDRPWGRNNPRWQLFAFGPLADLAPSGTTETRTYVAAWVADDPLENDANPVVDGDTSGGPNPGQGLVSVLVHAYGASRDRRVVEGTIARAGGRVRVVSWREVR